ncbi:MAG: hypothetical protein HKN47_19180 [Pirellulaceae bacterium]|nr:hypothetical protein [Pirellulaceae bacterium]
MLREDKNRQSRRDAYVLLLVIVMCVTAGRICTVTSKERDTAFLSANDRSRWCTVASLVEDGTYEIDRILELKSDKGRRTWYTIDLVRHRGEDGEQHFYSSKPPLYPTMVAGVYWLVHKATRLRMTEQPIYVPRIVLLCVNLPLLFLFCWCTIASMDLIAAGEWSRRLGAAMVCFGTMVTPFAISLNNHLPAAAATAVVMYFYLKWGEVLDDESDFKISAFPVRTWLIAGIAGGFTAANELPALSMLVFWIVLIGWLNLRSAAWFVAGIAIVAAAFFATNYIAHNQLRPAYAHRDNGPVIATIARGDKPSDQVIGDALAELDQPLFGGHLVAEISSDVTVQPSGEAGRWRVVTADNQLFALNRIGPDNASAQWVLSHWDDWYDYPGSYWNDGNRKGVDKGEPSRLIYFANMTIGHYGIFSITPIWFLVPFGLYLGLAYGPPDYRRLVIAIALATVVCLVFYLLRPQIDRNYGGVSSCFRWMLWFAPLWLLVIAPLLDKWSEQFDRRVILLALLGMSVFSMSISLDNPWQHPWIYRFWDFLGWIAK